MLYLSCTMISSVDFTNYGVSCAKDCVFLDCGTICFADKQFLDSITGSSTPKHLTVAVLNKYSNERL